MGAGSSLPPPQGIVTVSNAPSPPDVGITTKPREREFTRTRRQPPYNVILENDDHHSFEFVIDVLRKVLGCTEQRATQFAQEAHKTGRAIIWTGAREVAELKVEQISSFHEIRGSLKLGPVGCSLEPAPG
jgi:ATP-dependent Clp protease adaptor protein ClpS